MAALLRGDEGVDAVAREERWAQTVGLTGVPTVLLDDLVLFSGAQPAPVIVAALREAESLPSGEASRAAGPHR